MLHPNRRFIGRKEYFGSLIYDRQVGDYIPFDADATAIFEASLEQPMDRVYEAVQDRISNESFLTFLQLCQSIELMDQEGHFTGDLISTNLVPDQLTAPLRVYLSITRGCPLRCRHCYNSSGDALPNELSTGEVISLVDQMAAMGTCELSIGGGEPLWREDLFEIIAHARKKGIQVSISTNAVPVTRVIAKKIAEADLKMIKVSFDGASEKTYDYIRGKGTYRKAVRGMKILREAAPDVPVAIQAILMKPNLTEIPSLIRAVEKLKGNKLILQPIRKLGRAIENTQIMLTPQEVLDAFASVKRLREVTYRNIEIPEVPCKNGKNAIYKGFGCVCGNLFCHVDPTGIVAPTGFLVKEFPAGNIREKPLKEIWEQGVGLRVMRTLPGNPICAACDHLQPCRGGCKARSYEGTADLNSPDPFCPLKEEIAAKLAKAEQAQAEAARGPARSHSFFK
ncbi:MAG: radical SAM protein [Armatimonadetes bacterium]|nr:radical SAM protein [Armatimonadota bacterium]